MIEIENDILSKTENKSYGLKYSSYGGERKELWFDTHLEREQKFKDLSNSVTVSKVFRLGK